MRSTELIYFTGCPHVDAAREQLRRAFAEAGQPPRWVEYLSEDPSLPLHARGFASPTILVDGRDVAGAAAGSALACRLYSDEAGARASVPSLRSIVAALVGAEPVPR